MSEESLAIYKFDTNDNTMSGSNKVEIGYENNENTAIVTYGIAYPYNTTAEIDETASEYSTYTISNTFVQGTGDNSFTFLRTTTCLNTIETFSVSFTATSSDTAIETITYATTITSPIRVRYGTNVSDFGCLATYGTMRYDVDYYETVPNSDRIISNNNKKINFPFANNTDIVESNITYTSPSLNYVENSGDHDHFIYYTTTTVPEHGKMIQKYNLNNGLYLEEEIPIGYYGGADITIRPISESFYFRYFITITDILEETYARLIQSYNFSNFSETISLGNTNNTISYIRSNNNWGAYITTEINNLQIPITHSFSFDYEELSDFKPSLKNSFTLRSNIVYEWNQKEYKDFSYFFDNTYSFEDTITTFTLFHSFGPKVQFQNSYTKMISSSTMTADEQYYSFHNGGNKTTTTTLAIFSNICNNYSFLEDITNSTYDLISKNIEAMFGPRLTNNCLSVYAMPSNPNNYTNNIMDNITRCSVSAMLACQFDSDNATRYYPLLKNDNLKANLISIGINSYVSQTFPSYEDTFYFPNGPDYKPIHYSDGKEIGGGVEPFIKLLNETIESITNYYTVSCENTIPSPFQALKVGEAQAHGFFAASFVNITGNDASNYPHITNSSIFMTIRDPGPVSAITYGPFTYYEAGNNIKTDTTTFLLDQSIEYQLTYRSEYGNIFCNKIHITNYSFETITTVTTCTETKYVNSQYLYESEYISKINTTLTTYNPFIESNITEASGLDILFNNHRETITTCNNIGFINPERIETTTKNVDLYCCGTASDRSITNVPFEEFNEHTIKGWSYLTPWSSDNGKIKLQFYANFNNLVADITTTMNKSDFDDNLRLSDVFSDNTFSYPESSGELSISDNSANIYTLATKLDFKQFSTISLGEARLNLPIYTTNMSLLSYSGGNVKYNILAKTCTANIVYGSVNNQTTLWPEYGYTYFDRTTLTVSTT